MSGQRKPWRVRLDARISTCDGCARLIWDRYCPRCDAQDAGVS